MKTRDEIEKLNGFEYTSEVSKIILFSNNSENKDFIKWNKLELFTFYKEWQLYDKYGDPLTMKSTKKQMRIVVNDMLYNMISQVVPINGYLSRKNILDYIDTKRREIIIDELIN